MTDTKKKKRKAFLKTLTLAIYIIFTAPPDVLTPENQKYIPKFPKPFLERNTIKEYPLRTQLEKESKGYARNKEYVMFV